MMLRKTLPVLGLCFVAQVWAKKNDDNTGQEFRNNVATVRSVYHDLIGKLREGQSVSRSDVIGAYRSDPFLREESTGSGHIKFVCDLTGATFCVIGHGTKDITGAEERCGHHQALQTHVNVLKIFGQQYVGDVGLTKALLTMKPEDWSALRDQEDMRYEEYSRGKTAATLKRKKKKAS